VQQLQQHATARQLSLRFVPPKRPLPPLQLDEGKTRQVVMNLVDNALYYTKKGEVVVSLAAVGKQAELRVKDSGIGVPKAARDHLFTKFYRAGNAQNVRPDGTGLGLFLAKRVVEDQGGTIIFESIEGKGSTFGFSMPLTGKESRGTRK
jgi:signal transduction histidine kinase